MSLSVTITGDGDTHAFSATAVPANVNSCQLSARSANGSTIQIGGAEVSNTVGFELEPGAAMLIPSLQSYAALSYNIASGDTLDLLFVRLGGAVGGTAVV